MVFLIAHSDLALSSFTLKLYFCSPQDFSLPIFLFPLEARDFSSLQCLGEASAPDGSCVVPQICGSYICGSKAFPSV